MMITCSLVLIIAFILDITIGDPVYILHPVRLIGNFIALAEKKLFKMKMNSFQGGLILVISVILVSTLSFTILFYILCLFSKLAATVFSIFTLYSCIALGDLLKHSNGIYKSLEISTEKAQDKVQMIIGRNAKLLNKEEIIKATVESIAESFVDGILSPIFWYTAASIFAYYSDLNTLVAGTIAVIIQRSVNTIDSMIGYTSEKYILFGKCGAKLDDIINFIPARLSIPIIAITAVVLKLNYRNCLKIAFRDRLNHKSPNSAHPESAVAGALGIKLGGPTIYSYGTVNKPYIGDELNKIRTYHIKKVEKLIIVSSLITILLCVVCILSSSHKYFS